MSGIKHDSEKPDMSLLSSLALQKIAQVMTFGKRKYNANNWRGGIVYSRLEAAAMRHILAWNNGEDLDPESGISHIAHASCCLMMLLEFESTRPDLDDRYKASVVAPRIGEQLELKMDGTMEKWLPDGIKLAAKIFDNELGPGVTTYKPYKPKEQS